MTETVPIPRPISGSLAIDLLTLELTFRLIWCLSLRISTLFFFHKLQQMNCPFNFICLAQWSCHFNNVFFQLCCCDKLLFSSSFYSCYCNGWYYILKNLNCFILAVIEHYQNTLNEIALFGLMQFIFVLGLQDIMENSIRIYNPLWKINYL